MKDWISTIETAVLLMVIIRIISGSIEIIAALLMLKVNAVKPALMINSSLAIVGPLVLLTTTSIGLIGIADKISFSKLFFIGCGIVFIFVGLRS